MSAARETASAPPSVPAKWSPPTSENESEPRAAQKQEQELPREHPAAAIFPPMSAAAFAELKADIALNGQRVSIELWDGQVIDGRHRLRACVELGIDPKLVEVETNGDPVAHALSVNLHRRHLDASQRAIVGACIKRHRAAEARERQREGGRRGGKVSADLRGASDAASIGRKASEEAAAAVNVSPRLIEYAERVHERGAPELVDAMQRSEVRASVAAKLANLPKAKQKKAVAGGKDAIRAALRPKRKARPSRDAARYIRALERASASADDIQEQMRGTEGVAVHKGWAPPDTAACIKLIRKIIKRYQASLQALEQSDGDGPRVVEKEQR